MKTLFLVRHSNASRDDSIIEDIKRPLAPKGILRAEKAGEIIRKSFPAPDLILSSHALRAFSTALILAKTIPLPLEKIEKNRFIYRCHHTYLSELIDCLDDGYSCVMIVGHNPAITFTAAQLLQKETDFLLPCSFAWIQFDTTSWSVIKTPARFDIIDPSL